MSADPFRAMYAGRCASCGRRHIAPGDLVVKTGGGVAATRCRERDVRAREIEREMQEQHRVALGCWGIPDGCRPTFTRVEFYQMAVSLGVITAEEERQLALHFGSIYRRDLSD